ncbi:hypothetical protein BD626DRAFT_493484 [Schizophyllum amplum]|uniref:Uncharacterized protein n=1 Tax=Schizophyllum amplum TaxID=97359 RepID=A0A550CGT2_9AGAR|nr:hypothetical protein BD626DRAFT_493484 [Auriculariopsis ampla]
MKTCRRLLAPLVTKLRSSLSVQSTPTYRATCRPRSSSLHRKVRERSFSRRTSQKRLSRLTAWSSSLTPDL